MAAKEKLNLLDVIPCRSEHITVEREGETIVLSFPRFKYTWMQRLSLIHIQMCIRDREYFVHKRDSVMKANIPGFKEGVYMSTDSLLTDVRPINVPVSYTHLDVYKRQ